MRRGKRYLQEYQHEYIKDNCKQLTMQQMAAAIGCSYSAVRDYCKLKKLQTTKSYFQFRPPVIPVCVDWRKELRNVQECDARMHHSKEKDRSIKNKM